MTPKTKAHGWTTKDWHECLCAMGEDIIWTEKPEPGEHGDDDMIIPVCLLPPSTIDKVREFVEAMRKRDLNQSEIYYANELLKLLPGVE